MNAYVVFAKPRAVFFGYADESEFEKQIPKLKNARMCIYWSSGTKGALGLAKIGPQQGSRVSPSVPELSIKEQIEGFVLCTDEAIKTWESEPWG